jgi:hypothetical protein
MPTHIDSIYKNIDAVQGSKNAVDTLVEIDRILDRLDIYAYENWFKGEIVDGPWVERHWVECTIMYPQKMMPNPDGAMRLIKNGCKVKYGNDIFETFKKVEASEDIVTNVNGERHPKIEKHKVWLVNIRFPIGLLDVAEEVKDIDDVDFEDVEGAYAQELDSAEETDENNIGLNDEAS